MDAKNKTAMPGTDNRSGREAHSRRLIRGVMTNMFTRYWMVPALAISLALSACGTQQTGTANNDPQNQQEGAPVDVLQAGTVRGVIESPVNTTSGGNMVPLAVQNDIFRPGGIMTGLAAPQAGQGTTVNATRVMVWIDRPPYSDGSAGSLTVAGGDRLAFDSGNTYANDTLDGTQDGVYVANLAGNCPAPGIPASSAGAGAATPAIFLNGAAANCPSHRVLATQYNGVTSRRFQLASDISLTVDPLVAADSTHVLRFEFFTCATSVCTAGSEVRIATTVRLCTTTCSVYPAPGAGLTGDVILTRDSQPSMVMTAGYTRASTTLTIANSNFLATEFFSVDGHVYTAGTDFPAAVVDNAANRESLAQQIVTMINAWEFPNATGAATGASTSTSIVGSVTSTLSAVTGYYIGDTITFTSGALSGQTQTITAYNGATKTFTVAGFSSAPANNDTFRVSNNTNSRAVASWNGTNTFTVFATARGTAGNAVTTVDESDGTTNNLTGVFGALTGGTNGTATNGPLVVGDFPVQVGFGPVGYFQHASGLANTVGAPAGNDPGENFAALNVSPNDLLLVESGTNSGAIRRVIPGMPFANQALSTLNLTLPLDAAGSGLTYSIYHADVNQLRMLDINNAGSTLRGQTFASYKNAGGNKSLVSGVIWDGKTAAPPSVNDGTAQATFASAVAPAANNQILIRANGPGSWGNNIRIAFVNAANNVTVAYGVPPNIDITISAPSASTTPQLLVDLINSNPNAANLIRATCSAVPCETGGGAVTHVPAPLALTNLNLVAGTGVSGAGSNIASVSLRGVNTTAANSTSERAALISRSTTVGTSAQIVVDAQDNVGTGVCNAPYTPAANCTDEGILFYGTAGTTGINTGTITYQLPGADFGTLNAAYTVSPYSALITLERTTGAQARSTAEDIINAINGGVKATTFTGAAVNDRVRIRARTGGAAGNNIRIAYTNNPSPSVTTVVGGTIDITVNTPIPGTTAAGIVSLINSDTTASSYVYASLPAGTNGTGAIAALVLGAGTSQLANGAAAPGWLRAMAAPGNTGAGIPPPAAASGINVALMRGAATTGALVSSDPTIAAGIYWGGNCYPSNVTLAHDAISAPYGSICYTAITEVTEGATNYMVRASDSSGNPTSDTTSCAATGLADYCEYSVAGPEIILDTTPPQLLSQYNAGTQAASGFQTQKVWVEGAINPGAGAFQTFSTTVNIRGVVKDFKPGTVTIDDTTSQDSSRTYVRVQSDYLSYDSFALTTDQFGVPVPATEAGTATVDNRGYYNYANVPLRPGGLTSFTVTGWDQAGNANSYNFTVQQFVANTQTPPTFVVDCIVDGVPKNNLGAQILACEDDDFSPSPNSPIVMRTQSPNTAAAVNDRPNALGRWGDAGEVVATNPINFGAGQATGTTPTTDKLIVSATSVSMSGRFLSLDGGAPTVLVNGAGGVFTNFDLMPRDNPITDTLGTVTAHTAGTSQITLNANQAGNNLRPGDDIALSTLNQSQSSNVGLYQIAACNGVDAAGACDASTAPIGTMVLTLNRVLSQSAVGMYYQSAFVWMSNNMSVPNEGINNFTFVATDSLGNVRTTSMPVQRDTQPPSIVIQGVFFDPNSQTPVEMQTANPVVLLTDNNMFFGSSLTSPLAFATTVGIKRTDANGEGSLYTVTTGDAGAPFDTFTALGGAPLTACSRVVNECVGKTVTFTAGTAANIGIPVSITASTVGGVITVSPALPAAIVVATDKFVIKPAVEHFVYYTDKVDQGTGRSSSLDAWDNNATATYSCTAGTLLNAINPLGQASASTRSAPTGARPLTCDFSCSDKDATPGNQCIPGAPMTYQVNVAAWDRSGRTSTTDVTFSLVEDSAGALLGGALGILSTNPAVVSTLSDATGLKILLFDQLSNSGTLYNMDYRMASLLGNPNIPITSTANTRANFYLTSRNSFGNLLGTILTDPDGTGTAQSTAVTLSNVVRILMDNGVFDDILPIIDNPQILDPKARVGFPSTPTQGDASKMSQFTEELLRDVAEVATNCYVGGNAQDQYQCFSQAGPIKNTFDAIKATLDYNQALRVKNGAIANADAKQPRVSGINDTMGANSITGLAANVNFLPVPGTPTSQANVQVGDVVTIVDPTKACNTSYATVTVVNSATSLTTTAWSGGTAGCTGAGANCKFKITPQAGPALNTVIELADVLLYSDLDGDGLGGERETLQALLHMAEESMKNLPIAQAPSIYDRASLLCKITGDPCNAAQGIQAVNMLDFNNAPNMQGALDLFAELADDGNSANGTEFISQAVNMVNYLLQPSTDITVPSGATNLETMTFITRDLLGSLLTEPATSFNPNSLVSVSGRQNTRLNLLLRSIAALGFSRSAVTVTFPSSGTVSPDNALEASMSLLDTLANDPDDNPRGCTVLGTCSPYVAPGSGPQLSILDKLETPISTLLKDSRFPTLLNNVGAVLDPGTGISDLTAFQHSGTVSEQPFTATPNANPYTVNPPLLGVLTQFTKARIDSDADGSGVGEQTPVDIGVNILNILLTGVGSTNGTENFDPVNFTVATDVCREAYFAGATPMEKLLNVLSQLAQPADKDPKDYDYRNRTLPDCNGLGASTDPKSDNRTYIRIILDALTDDPGTTAGTGDDDRSLTLAPVEPGSTSVVMPNAFSTVAPNADAVSRNGWDDIQGSAVTGYTAGNKPFATSAAVVGAVAACAGPNPSGSRTATAGDGLAVPQRTLDILPELLNTITRYGFNNSDKLTSIFADCNSSANCKVNNGYPTGTNRWLSGQRLALDMGLLLDQPLQVGGGTTGLLQFENSLTREFIESIANLTTTQAVNQLILLMNQLSDSIQPINGTLKIPNTQDITHITALVRSLADPDGDGDPLPDGVIDKVIPIIQAISAAGMTQQVLDLLRSMRGCGVDVPSGKLDIRGGQFFTTSEDMTLAMLDAFSGATKESLAAVRRPDDPSASAGVAPDDDTAGQCPWEGATPGDAGIMGGILDSNPVGTTNATYPVNRGVLVGGSDLRIFGTGVAGDIPGDALVGQGTYVFAGNWASAVTGTVVTAGTTTTNINATGISCPAGEYIGSLITFTSGAQGTTPNRRSRIITACPAAGTVTIAPALPAAPVNPDTFVITAPSQKFGELGVGAGDTTGSPSGGFLCVPVAFSPYSEKCGQIVGVPYTVSGSPVACGAAPCPYDNTTPNQTGGFLRFNNTTTQFTNANIGNVVAASLLSNCDMRDTTKLNNCSYRVRQMREPYNGCVGGIPFGNNLGRGFGVGLSSAGVDPMPAVPNVFRDARLDLILRQLNFLMDGGNEPNLTTSSFSTRIGNLLKTVGTPDPVSGDPSILSIFMFGVSGPGSGTTGPLQALLNDTAARSGLAGTLNLFSQTAAGVSAPVAAPNFEDPFDRYPNFTAVALTGGWDAGATCTSAGFCDGNAVHDAIDYQLLALQGILNVLSQNNGNGADTVAGINAGTPAAGAAKQGWSDDPSVLFNMVATLLQQKYISNLYPGIQIIAEATTGVPMADMDLRADPARSNAPAMVNKIESKAMAYITRRIASSVDGEETPAGYVAACPSCIWATGTFPQNQSGILSNIGAAPAGIYEGPMQALVRSAIGMLDEFISNRDYDSTAGFDQPFSNTNNTAYNNYLERSRFVALEDLVGVLTGASGGPKNLNKALTVLYNIARDTDGTVFPTSVRSLNKILSVQVGLSQRGIVDVVTSNKSALDVIADFMNTLVEDPTDCDAATTGFQRGVKPSGAAVGDVIPSCIYGRPLAATTNTNPDSAAYTASRPNQNAAFRDVGVLVERPIQPILDPTAFTSLSQLFAGGDNSKITGALPFFAAIVRDTQYWDIQDKSPVGPVTKKYRGVQYTAGVKIADALFQDLQDLIPGTDEDRFDPLITDDMNRNGLLDTATVLVGVGDTKNGAGGPWFSIFDAPAVASCLANCPKNEADNFAYDCSPPQGFANGSALVACTLAGTGDPNTINTPVAGYPNRRVSVGFTAADNGITLGNVNGLNAAFFDSLADLIALENTGVIVNNQLPRTNTGQTMDQYTVRTLGATSVDPSFTNTITALGDLLLQTNH